MARAVDRPERTQLTGETLGYMQRLWDVVHALDVRSKRMGRLLGVTGPQRLVIRVVGRSPDLTASEVAETMGIHPSTLTGILSRLEKQGLLDRKVDVADRRRARFALTARGVKIDREKKGTVEAAVRRAVARAGNDTVTKSLKMLELLVHELGRDD